MEKSSYSLVWSCSGVVTAWPAAREKFVCWMGRIDPKLCIESFKSQDTFDLYERGLELYTQGFNIWCTEWFTDGIKNTTGAQLNFCFSKLQRLNFVHLCRYQARNLKMALMESTITQKGNDVFARSNMKSWTNKPSLRVFCKLVTFLVFSETKNNVYSKFMSKEYQS